jgi:hypothetical protein
VYKDVTLFTNKWANGQTADILGLGMFCNFISWQLRATNQNNQVAPAQVQHVPGLTQSWMPFCI